MAVSLRWNVSRAAPSLTPGVLFCECRCEIFRATPAAQKNFHFSLAIPKRFAIVSPSEGNQSDAQPKKQMKDLYTILDKSGMNCGEYPDQEAAETRARELAEPLDDSPATRREMAKLSRFRDEVAAYADTDGNSYHVISNVPDNE